MTKCRFVLGWIRPISAFLAILNPGTFYPRASTDFQSPDQESRVPPLFSPSHLTYFLFRGVREYMDDLVAYIDSPQLDHVSVTFSTKSFWHTTSHPIRTPSLKALQNAFVDFRVGASATSLTSGHKKLSACRGTLTWEGVDICSRAQGRNLPIQPSA